MAQEIKMKALAKDADLRKDFKGMTLETLAKDYQGKIRLTKTSFPLTDNNKYLLEFKDRFKLSADRKSVLSAPFYAVTLAIKGKYYYVRVSRTLSGKLTAKEPLPAGVRLNGDEGGNPDIAEGRAWFSLCMPGSSDGATLIFKDEEEFADAIPATPQVTATETEEEPF